MRNIMGRVPVGNCATLADVLKNLNERKPTSFIKGLVRDHVKSGCPAGTGDFLHVCKMLVPVMVTCY